MSLGNAPVMRLCFAVAVVLASGAVVARSADRSIPDAVTDAFETIVIDATKAASKAKDAAQDALAPDSRKAKRKEPSRKTDSGKAAKPQEQPPTDNAAAKDGKKPPESKKADKAPAGKEQAPAAPGAKAAGGAPADPKDAKPADARKPAIATEWPAVEVELARARCTQILKGVDAVTIPEAPFRKGDCGTMAPVRLVSIGKDPEVSFSPPPVVTCDLVVGLAKWVKAEVQPAAKRHLGSEVIRIDSMSDYSCRMAYGRIGNKLSEHGKANALDIRGFITSKGDQAIVLTHWGQTRRDVLRQLVAAKAAAEKAEARKAAAENAKKKKDGTAATDGKDAETVTELPRTTIAEGLAKKDGKQSLAIPTSITKNEDLGAKSAARKDGKKERKDAKRRSREENALLAALTPEEAAKAKAPAPGSPTARFLHQIHASACRIFGTTLGPEANEAHRNHFHVDMAERKFRKICD